jgi:hypothetical protein
MEIKPLRIIRKQYYTGATYTAKEDYTRDLAQLAIAEAILVRAGKTKALPHFIAIVKELERIHGFHFECFEEE